ncbi:MAG: cell division protein ZapA [Candidatus Lambdaproteobacteria bacterium]|nr:cell division protein ZapA [Candidatus Lambdaproteobacteria bacterium]
MEPTESNWYDITIAGKQFTISTHHGEAHVRRVEKLLGETMDEISSRIDAKNPLNVALLTALNLADQLILRDAETHDSTREWSGRLNLLVDRLGETLRRSRALGAE